MKKNAQEPQASQNLPVSSDGVPPAFVGWPKSSLPRPSSSPGFERRKIASQRRKERLPFPARIHYTR